MPSHAAHLAFALANAAPFFGVPGLREREPGSRPLRSSLAWGSEAPDMFYHNRRTRPSGLYISAAIHRRGFAGLCAELFASASTEPDETSRESLLAFAAGFLSHGILDRHLHPLINYVAAWEEAGSAGTEIHRYQHTIMERMVDLLVCRRLDCAWMLGPAFPALLKPEGLAREQRAPIPQAASEVFLEALCAIYLKCRNDELLNTRMHNAWGDSVGFYTWSSDIDASTYRRLVAASRDAWIRLRSGEPSLTIRAVKDGGEVSGDSDNAEDYDDEIILQRAAIIHPRLDLKALEGLSAAIANDQGAEWTDPCAPEETLWYSLDDLWNKAGNDCVATLEELLPFCRNRASGGADREVARGRIHEIILRRVDEGDLRTWLRNGSGCSTRYCKPIDLFGLWFELAGLLQTGRRPGL